MFKEDIELKKVYCNTDEVESKKLNKKFKFLFQIMNTAEILMKNINFITVLRFITS